MEYLHTNLSQELTQLLYLSYQIGVEIRWLNRYESNSTAHSIIKTLSEILIQYGGICDSILHNNSSLLIKYSEELHTALDKINDEKFIELLNSFGILKPSISFNLVFEAQFALKSIITKTEKSLSRV